MNSLSTFLRGYLIELWEDYGTPSIILILLLLLLGAGNIIRYYQSARSASPHQPIVVLATAALPTLLPESTQGSPLAKSDVARISTAGLVFQRVLIVYDAPNGTAIGPIEPGRAYTLIVRAGSEWVQADVEGSGQVWVRAIDLAGAPNIPDIATPVPPPSVNGEAPRPPREAPPEAPHVLAVPPTWSAPPTQVPAPDVPQPDQNQAVTSMPDLVQPSPVVDADAWQRLQERNDERRALKSVDDPTPTRQPSQ